MRETIVAGQFYESDPELLKEQLNKLFEVDSDKCSVKGMIVPHAGYFFSGKCAAKGYKMLENKPELVVILGASHSGKTALTSKDWNTPLGVVKTDKEFCEKLKANGLVDDPSAHEMEHSIEVQLPFLQHLFDDVKIVGINVGHEFEKVVEAIKKSLDNRNVLFIVSSDFTHYGMSYRYVPFTNNVKEKMYEMDKKAIDLICSLNVVELNKYLRDIESTICGKYAIMALMQLVDVKGKLIEYYTSADVYGEYNQAVGYGLIVF